MKNGFLIVEAYFNGGNWTIAGHIQSATKSVVSALVGIALHQGYLDNLEQKWVDFFPEYRHLSPHYEEKSGIRVRITKTVPSRCHDILAFRRDQESLLQIAHPGDFALPAILPDSDLSIAFEALDPFA